MSSHAPTSSRAQRGIAHQIAQSFWRSLAALGMTWGEGAQDEVVHVIENAQKFSLLI